MEHDAPLLKLEAVTTLDMDTLFPETVAYDRKHSRLLVGSVTTGGVYEVSSSGVTRRVIDDPRLCSVLGIAIDSACERIYVANSNLGVGQRACNSQPRSTAGIGVYDLRNGKAIRYVDLASLAPATAHLANGVAVDPKGNAYISDSFASRIYKLTPDGTASIWLEDPAFDGPGIGLNGLVAHPGGSLMVVKKNDGRLFRVPLNAPQSWSEVSLEHPIPGADGVVLTTTGDLVVIANSVGAQKTDSAVALSSHDGWQTARVAGRTALDDEYPTGGVQVGDDLYVLSSSLEVLLNAESPGHARLRRPARLGHLGRVTDLSQLNQARSATHPDAFVYAEVQPAPGSLPIDLRQLGAWISRQPGFLNLTWLQGSGGSSPTALLSFDGLERARDFASKFFPARARELGVGQSTKLFDARVVEAASRDMNSPLFGAPPSEQVRAFVYTEVQIDAPFEHFPWRQRNPQIRAARGWLSKTWLSGVRTHTVGGLYAFDSMENANHFALVFFPQAAAARGVAFTAIVYDAIENRATSTALASPFFPGHSQATAPGTN